MLEVPGYYHMTSEAVQRLFLAAPGSSSARQRGRALAGGTHAWRVRAFGGRAYCSSEAADSAANVASSIFTP